MQGYLLKPRSGWGKRVLGSHHGRLSWCILENFGEAKREAERVLWSQRLLQVLFTATLVIHSYCILSQMNIVIYSGDEYMLGLSFILRHMYMYMCLMYWVNNLYISTNASWSILTLLYSRYCTNQYQQECVWVSPSISFCFAQNDYPLNCIPHWIVMFFGLCENIMAILR